MNRITGGKGNMMRLVLPNRTLSGSSWVPHPSRVGVTLCILCQGNLILRLCTIR